MSPVDESDTSVGAERSGTVTWRELLSEATDRLRRIGAESDSRRIVEEACGVEPAELALVLGEPATEGGVARFDSMVTRRSAGEPLQYVLGHWGFRQLDLAVDPRVLIPRPETETVVQHALDELDHLGAREVDTRVVDLGTGSGAIALSIATERVRTRVWATDASSDALALAGANLAGTGRAATRVRLLEGDWFDALPDELRGTLQMVISNPPYVATGADLPAEVLDWEPTAALLAGGDGLDDLRRIVADAPDWLEPGGVLVCEISPEQAGAVSDLAETRFAEVQIADDLTGRARALIARGPRAAG
ncbi:MAG: peptide chain release factor N(5)-glutamine methyltransferase [Microthrixaceae bacterium]|nr:peptide chain release factor N(5)-glutamine methyltransferase [Microthrixaceae bacterium]MCB1011278.1 peptide chain release factor N(5)-glutamine methyltransferase [Microthrixaceae bacterium]MCO5321843.1 peptide chain release factor N(5)-glutamine methyltransferase [Microthrixaceae bacterium]